METGGFIGTGVALVRGMCFVPARDAAAGGINRKRGERYTFVGYRSFIED